MLKCHLQAFPPCLVQVCRSGDAAQRAASACVPGSRKRRRQPMGHLKWCLACAVQRHGHAHADQLPALPVAALHVCACATMRQASLILWADAGSERGPPWLLHKQLAADARRTGLVAPRQAARWQTSATGKHVQHIMRYQSEEV